MRLLIIESVMVVPPSCFRGRAGSKRKARPVGRPGGAGWLGGGFMRLRLLGLAGWTGSGPWLWRGGRCGPGRRTAHGGGVEFGHELEEVFEGREGLVGSCHDASVGEVLGGCRPCLRCGIRRRRRSSRSFPGPVSNRGYWDVLGRASRSGRRFHWVVTLVSSGRWRDGGWPRRRGRFGVFSAGRSR